MPELSLVHGKRLSNGEGVEMSDILIPAKKSRKKDVKITNFSVDKGTVVREASTRHAVDKILKKYGAWFFAPVNFGIGREGVPDNICCINGKFVAIESKGHKTGHKLTEVQKRCLQDIENAGGYTFVATPTNLEELDRWVRALCK